MVRFTLAMAFVAIPWFVYSQTELPKIVSPSPETSALFRFQDYPMDYSTGLPQISIPIYEVKSGSLTVPINISYHASGRRVSDVDGPVALGWSLNAGGMISRTVYGSEDFGPFKFPYPFRTTDLSMQNDLKYLQEIAHYAEYDAPGQFKDSEYDVFSFSINGTSGKFVFKDINNVKEAVLIPYRPFVVKAITGGSQHLGTIEITDDQGIFYSFAATEIAGVFSGTGAYTGYSLKQIISADKTDTITFTYTGSTQSRVFISRQWILDDETDYQSPPPGFAASPLELESKNTELYQISRLTEIKFNQGKVIFNLVAGTDKVDNIQILNLENEILKTIQLTRSTMNLMSDGNPPANKLDNVIFKDKAGTPIEKYSFEYFPIAYPNGSSIMDLRHCDFWGYYNASGVNGMVPYFRNIGYTGSGGYSTISIGDFSSNRNPKLSALKSGVLSKITFPTGGTTEFNYECNQYLSLETNQVSLGPGLRISQIVTSDNKGTINSRTFKYGVGECGYSFIELDPSLQNSMMSQMMYDYVDCMACLGFEPDGYCGTYKRRTFSSGFVPEASELGQRPIIYREVTEYLGTINNNIGKTVYTYDYTAWGLQSTPGGAHIPVWNYWDNPSLLNQSDYKVTTSPVGYTKVREKINTYSKNTLEDIVGLHVKRNWTLGSTGLSMCGGGGPTAGLDPEAHSQQSPFPIRAPIIYSFAEYRIPVGVKNLQSTTIKEYNSDGSTIVSSTSYNYNAKQYLWKTTTSNSDGSTVESQVKYPFDYTGNAVLTQMTSNLINMLNFPIEKLDFNNGSQVSGTRTNYLNWGSANPMFAPQTVELKLGSSAYETRLRYYSYDIQGNPTLLSKDNDVVHSYLWDYKKTYPIAEIVNANPSSVACTSFESDGSGNWSGILKANVKTDAPGITGKKYYLLTGSTLSLAGLNAADTYVISYWSRNSSCSVSGTTQAGWPKNLRTVTINGITWNYWEHRVSNATTITISGTASIDELRLFPATSQMTSYTYEPLIGVTSQCDANNNISYFEYDPHGRLKLVRDINGDILKTATYKYQSTTP